MNCLQVRRIFRVCRPYPAPGHKDMVADSGFIDQNTALAYSPHYRKT